MNREEQLSEVEVLKSIYWDDFKEITLEPNVSFSILVKNEENPKLSFNIQLQFNEDYPVSSIPEVSITAPSLKSLETVQQHLISKAQELIGSQMTFTLIEEAKQFIAENPSLIAASTATTTEAGSSSSAESTGEETEEYTISKLKMTEREVELSPQIELKKLAASEKEASAQRLFLSCVTTNGAYNELTEETEEASVDVDKLFQCGKFINETGFKLNLAYKPRETTTLDGRTMACTISTPSRLFIYGGLLKGQLTHDLFSIGLQDKELTVNPVKLGSNSSFQTTVPRLLCASAARAGYYGGTVIFLHGGIGVTTLNNGAEHAKVADTLLKIYVSQNQKTIERALEIPSVPLCGHSMALFKGEENTDLLISFGGCIYEAYREKLEYTNSCYAITSERTVKFGVQTGETPAPRAGHAMVRVDNQLYIYGGHNDKGVVFDDLWCWTIDTSYLSSSYFTRIKVLSGPSPCLTHATLMLNGTSLLLSGGWSPTKGWTSTILEFDIEANHWRSHVVTDGSDVFSQDVIAQSSENKTEDQVTKQPPVFGATGILNSTLIVLPGLRGKISTLSNGFYTDYFALCSFVRIRSSMHRSLLSLTGERNCIQLISFKSRVGDQSFQNLRNTLREWLFSQSAKDSDVVFNFMQSKKKLYAHRHVLQRSSYFRKLLAREGGSSLIEFTVLDENSTIPSYGYGNYLDYAKPSNFVRVIEFLYTNSFSFPSNFMDNDVREIFELAKSYGIPLLQQVCTGTVDFETLYSECIPVVYSKIALPLLVPKKPTNAPRGLVEIMSNHSHSLVAPEPHKQKHKAVAHSPEAEEATVEHAETPEDEEVVDEPFDEQLMDEYPEDENIEIPDVEGVDDDIPNEDSFDYKPAPQKQQVEQPKRIVHHKAQEVENQNARAVLVHKGLLQARLPFFKSMFEGSFMESSQNRIMIEQCSIESIMVIMYYVYTDIVCKIRPESAIELYLFCHQYNLDALMPVCRSTIRDNISMDVVFTILELAELICDQAMIQFCVHFIAKNFKPLKKIAFDTKRSYASNEEAETGAQQVQPSTPEEHFNCLASKLQAEIISSYLKHYHEKPLNKTGAGKLKFKKDIWKPVM